MKIAKFTESQILTILKEAEAGVAIDPIVNTHWLLTYLTTWRMHGFLLKNGWMRV
jgi:hypothetical protein